MRRFGRAITVLLLVALAACGGRGSDLTKAAPTGTTHPPPASWSGSTAPRLSPQPVPPAHRTAPQTAEAAPQAQATTRSRSRVVRWIKNMGITGGGSWEGNAAAYDAIARGDCDNVFRVEPTSFDHDMKQLYYGAAWACLAAFEGQSAQWMRAEDAYNTMSNRNHDFGCLEVAAYEILRDLVQAHRSDPDARFIKGGNGKAAAPLCPWVKRVEPDHGPAQGGYEVHLTGENLPVHATIVWNSETIAVTTETDRKATMTVPAGTPGDGVMVMEKGWPYGIAGAAWFEYDKAASVGSASPDD